MNKRGPTKDWELHGLREGRGAPATTYTAPDEKQKWRARDLIDIHWKLTGIKTPSKSYNRIMSCIIGHANPKTGRCQIKHILISAETGYSVPTIKRAVKWWVAKGFLIKQEMGRAKSNAYHPQWDLFEMHWLAIDEDIKAQKETWSGVTKGNHAEVIEGNHDGDHHGDLQESQSRTLKKESHPERDHPPSADRSSGEESNSQKEKKALQEEKEKRALQEETVTPCKSTTDDKLTAGDNQ